MAEGGRGELFILEQRFALQQMQKAQSGAKMFLVTSLRSKLNTQVKHCSETRKAALKRKKLLQLRPLPHQPVKGSLKVIVS